MAVRAFVDTNILVYLFGADDRPKQAAARELLLNDDLDLVLSTQVLNEFYVTVTRKIAAPLSANDASEAVASIAQMEVVPVTRNLVLDAIRTGEKHRLSHWDSLIVEAASRSGCDLLFTEDLSSGSTLRGVTITNPFDSD